MKYYVSLVDHHNDVAKLEAAAKRFYNEVMLIKQDALCRLEATLPMATLLQSSYNINERLHQTVGKLIAKYTQPQELVIDDHNEVIDSVEIETAISHNVALLRKASENALDDIIAGSDVPGLEGLESHLTESELDAVNAAGEIFFVVVVAVFEKQAAEFLGHVKETQSFSARVRAEDKDNPLGDAVVEVGMF